MSTACAHHHACKQLHLLAGLLPWQPAAVHACMSAQLLDRLLGKLVTRWGCLASQGCATPCRGDVCAGQSLTGRRRSACGCPGTLPKRVIRAPSRFSGAALGSVPWAAHQTATSAWFGACRAVALRSTGQNAVASTRPTNVIVVSGANTPDHPPGPAFFAAAARLAMDSLAKTPHDAKIAKHAEVGGPAARCSSKKFCACWRRRARPCAPPPCPTSTSRTSRSTPTPRPPGWSVIQPPAAPSTRP